MPFELYREQTVVYELYLPVNDEYYNELIKILDFFSSDKSIRQHKEFVRIVGNFNWNETKQDRYAKEIRDVVSGYSIYKVEGCFISNGVKIKEPSWVIRFILYDANVKGSMTTEFAVSASYVMEHYIGKCLAEKIEKEKEIWLLQYPEMRLSRLVKEEKNIPLNYGKQSAFWGSLWDWLLRVWKAIRNRFACFVPNNVHHVPATHLPDRSH